jgi:two-component system alkaline phosphatase synthesis response regulator PhoP
MELSVSGRICGSVPAATDPTTVLVIDDEPSIRLLCRVNLEAEGIEVLEAGDGLRGVELARAVAVDAIVLDVMLPGLDGPGVAEELLADERTRSIPIVFLTGRAELRECALTLGLDGVEFVTKPFDPLGLAAVIRGLVARGGKPLRPESIAGLRRIVAD